MQSVESQPTFRRKRTGLSACFHVGFLLCLFFDPKMETTHSSETSAHFQRTLWHYIPECRSPHNYCCENLRSCKLERFGRKPTEDLGQGSLYRGRESNRVDAEHKFTALSLHHNARLFIVAASSLFSSFIHFSFLFLFSFACKFFHFTLIIFSLNLFRRCVF
jgi:hypothetical protein